MTLGYPRRLSDEALGRTGPLAEASQNGYMQTVGYGHASKAEEERARKIIDEFLEGLHGVVHRSKKTEVKYRPEFSRREYMVLKMKRPRW